MFLEIRNAVETINELKRLKRKSAKRGSIWIRGTRMRRIDKEIKGIVQNTCQSIVSELKLKDRPTETDEWIKDYLETIKKGRLCEGESLGGLTKEEERAWLFWSWRGDFEERRELLSSFLSKDNIDRLNTKKIEEMLQYSWAPTRWWSDKPWKAMEVLEKNGLSTFKRELKLLIYGQDTIERRFDRFRERIKGFGVDYITEILVFIFPDKYCLWNRVAADISILLGINQLLPISVWKYRMEVNGEDYIKCCRTLEIIKDSLIKNQVQSPNFLDVYHFMFCTFRKLKDQAPFVFKAICDYSMQASLGLTS